MRWMDVNHVLNNFQRVEYVFGNNFALHHFLTDTYTFHIRKILYKACMEHPSDGYSIDGQNVINICFNVNGNLTNIY